MNFPLPAFSIQQLCATGSEDKMGCHVNQNIKVAIQAIKQ
jgi:hypothetical protein